MTDCIFCKIINKEIPADIVFEDEHVLAFLDIKPTSKGHTLVVPKIHVENFLSATTEVMSNFFPSLQTVSKAVAKAVRADGLSIRTANGPAAGQSVFHLHFHVTPRFTNDGLAVWPQRDSEPKTRAEIAERIKKEIPNDK